jgi:hypothetical protein
LVVGTFSKKDEFTGCHNHMCNEEGGEKFVVLVCICLEFET